MSRRDDLYLSVHQTFLEVNRAYSRLARQQVMDLYKKAGIGEGHDVWLALVSAGFSPDPVAVEPYFNRSPYTNKALLSENLQGAADRGWINLTEDVFTATEKSISLNDQEEQLTTEVLGAVAENTSVDISRLAELLSTLFQAADRVDLPVKPTFYISRIFDKDDRTPVLDRAVGWMVALLWYRDDCHISSWQHYDLPGVLWEAFSFIWQGEFTTAEEIAEERFQYRGYEADEYASAIEQLIEMGWVEVEGDGSRVTSLGQEERQKAEALTNQYYSQAFVNFSEQEVQELLDLMKSLLEEMSLQEDALSV